MPKSQFVDFKAIKSALTMERVLAHYGLLEKFKRSNDTLTGPCPIHKGKNPTQFRVSLTKNLFNCFSECKNGGNPLDFIARMEDVDVHSAALKAIEWFNLDVDTGKDEENDEIERPKGNSEKAKSKPAPDSNQPNKPLAFRLEKLQRDHPYLAERGLTLETVIDFGIGFCAKGVMGNHIAIPIHNPKDEVVAYAGRFPGEPPEETPKYKLPQGFRKSQELYNIDRAIKEPANLVLIMVEGFFDCMKLHQLGHRKVVALMGNSLSASQEELIRKHFGPNTRIIVMLDENEAGITGREEIAPRLAKHAFVRIHEFEQEDMEPEHLDGETLRQIVGGVQ
jgi:DNA primase